MITPESCPVLIYATRRKTNAANIHRAVQLLRSYEMALEYAVHPRCRDRREAWRRIEETEHALREFAGVLP